MLTSFFHVIGTNTPIKVFEIGGGFGNMLRIVDTLGLVDNWTIFDLDFVCDAQAYFIKQTCPELTINRNSYDNSPGTVNLIDQHHRNIVKRNLEPADVMIGTHSWSELTLNDFLWYYDAILPLTSNLLYATQVKWPSPELTRKKLEYIRKSLRTSPGNVDIRLTTTSPQEQLPNLADHQAGNAKAKVSTSENLLCQHLLPIDDQT